ncbi:MAG: carboxypeptidase regulatory-like domain-containing protein, partial [Defluviitaleaceae bacterium]|nr:carboxypeptidase regulatory-like domain-containing protein [Defluviitaleaceae bacterium]
MKKFISFTLTALMIFGSIFPNMGIVSVMAEESTVITPGAFPLEVNTFGNDNALANNTFDYDHGFTINWNLNDVDPGASPGDWGFRYYQSQLLERFQDRTVWSDFTIQSAHQGDTINVLYILPWELSDTIGIPEHRRRASDWIMWSRDAVDPYNRVNLGAWIPPGVASNNAAHGYQQGGYFTTNNPGGGDTPRFLTQSEWRNFPNHDQRGRQVRGVSTEVFKTHWEEILFDENGNHRWDVISVGSADYGALAAFSRSTNDSRTINALNSFLDSGRGILFTHDTIIDRFNVNDLYYQNDVRNNLAHGTVRARSGATNHYGWGWSLAPMANRAGIIPSVQVSQVSHITKTLNSNNQASQRNYYLDGQWTANSGNFHDGVMITQTGPLTSYPHRFYEGQVIRVAYDTHSNGSLARGDVWGQFVINHGNQNDPNWLLNDRYMSHGRIQNMSGHTGLAHHGWHPGSVSPTTPNAPGGNLVVNFPGRYVSSEELNQNRLWSTGAGNNRYTNTALPGFNQEAGTYQSNFYLTTNNNTAHMQIWNDSATLDERMLYVNTLFHLAQVTERTEIHDFTAADVNAPEIENYTARTIQQDGEFNLNISATDTGTSFRSFVEALDQRGGRSPRRSDTVETTLESGIRGYFYVINDRPVFTPVINYHEGRVIHANDAASGTRYIADNEDGVAIALSEFGVNSEQDMQGRFLHMVAVDRAGNVGDVLTIGLDDTFNPDMYPPRIEVLVVDTEGNVIPNADLQIIPALEGNRETAKVNNEGLAIFYGEADLISGEADIKMNQQYTFIASHPDNALSPGVGFAIITEDAPVSKITIELGDSGKSLLYGFVTDAANNQPIANALVNIPGVNRETRTNDEGFYFFLNLDPTNYTVLVNADNYNPSGALVRIPDAGVAVQQDFALNRDSTGNNSSIIHGVVYNADVPTEVLSGIEVKVGNHTATADNFGHYFARVNRGSEVEINVVKEGFADYNETATIETDMVEHDVPMQPLRGGFIHVQVLNNGVPVAAEVLVLGDETAFPVEVDPRDGVVESVYSVYVGSGTEYLVVAAVDGHLAASRSVTIQRDSRIPNQTDETPRLLVTFDIGDDLPPANNPGLIYGRVIESSDNVTGIVDASVTAVAVNAQTKSVSNGWYVLNIEMDAPQ